MAKDNKTVLRLIVPSGAKLSEVRSEVNLLGTLLSAFMIHIVSERPRLKREILRFLEGYRASLPLNEQATLDEAIAFVRRIDSD